MRTIAGFLLAAVLLSGCGGAEWTPGGDAALFWEAYRPVNYRENKTWKKLNARLLHYGRVARPDKPDSYWRLHFVRSKIPMSAGNGVVYVPDLWIEKAPPGIMDFMFAHEIAHDALEHRFFWTPESSGPSQIAEMEADTRAVQILNKADGSWETKTKINEFLRIFGAKFPPLRVANLKAAMKRLK